MLRLLFFLAPLVLTVFCLVDAISSRDDEVRHLGKSWWILLILFFPLVGSLAWLIVGRPESGRPRLGAHQRATPDFPEYDRPGRFAASDPEADAEFLRQVRERAEEQRRRHREQREAEKRRAAQEEPADRQDDADGEVAPG